ncbi:enoyl-CoA hydratase/isomerase family protein [Myxococcota bacterium]|nr:enoyl-CoA hydratase/isomerase family protein [Myxococcota bacterium]MBU1429603.1 enoyl-CoA hydratase/isomerase family protein [Myxococcota bacterium]MBU1897409.1 enoyl-CoA hydratase/isomerase family protein [Myxococcota bacterium]
MPTPIELKHLRLERRESVAVLYMDHEAENRFHPDLLAEMLTALDQIEADKALRAVVLTGSDPKFFCNGLDLDWMMAHGQDIKALDGYMRALNAVYKRWTLFSKPTVAALNGHTFAGGLFLAAHLDFRLMRADRGWISLPEVKINIPLLPGMIAICQATMTPAGFHKLYYTGERFGAAEAIEMGFVEAAYPEATLLNEAIALAARLGEARTRTYAEMKRRIRAEIARLLDEEDPKHFMSTLSFSR